AAVTSPPGQPAQTGQWLETEYQKRSAQKNALVSNDGRGADVDKNMLSIPPPELSYFQEAAWGKAVKCVSATVDPMAAEWRRGKDGADRLMFIRTVRSDGLTFHQGALVDWPKLRAVLLEEVRDLLPDADLEPADGPSSGDQMTALPVRLVTGPPAL